MSRQRFIDIVFDRDGYPDRRTVGQVIRNSDGVNVLRVIVPIPRASANMTAAFERPDGEVGSGLMVRTWTDPVTVYTYVLTSWATAYKGELKMSFALLYPEPLSGAEIVNGDTVERICPVDYLRMVTLRVEDSVGPGDPLGSDPNVTADVLGQIGEIREDVDRLDLEQDVQDGKIAALEQNPLSLDMGTWS